jgi:hypothetical protein
LAYPITFFNLLIPAWFSHESRSFLCAKSNGLLFCCGSPSSSTPRNTTDWPSVASSLQSQILYSLHTWKIPVIISLKFLLGQIRPNESSKRLHLCNADNVFLKLKIEKGCHVCILSTINPPAKHLPATPTEFYGVLYANLPRSKTRQTQKAIYIRNLMSPARST